MANERETGRDPSCGTRVHTQALNNMCSHMCAHVLHLVLMCLCSSFLCFHDVDTRSSIAPSTYSTASRADWLVAPRASLATTVQTRAFPRFSTPIYNVSSEVDNTIPMPGTDIANIMKTSTFVMLMPYTNTIVGIAMSDNLPKRR